jgi:ribonuclease VapC
MIVDSSAIVSILRKEPDWLEYLKAIESAEYVRLSAASYLETAIVMDKERDPVISAGLDDLIHESKIIIEPVTPEQVRIARQAYRDYGRGSGHPANLNFGDCFSYALARDKREPVLFKGDDFIHTDLRSAMKS